jgi:hypothetical protein
LNPANLREPSRVFQNHSRSVRDRHRVIRANLDHQVAVTEFWRQPIDVKRWQRLQPGWRLALSSRHKLRAKTKRNGQSRGPESKLWLRVSKGRFTLSYSSGIRTENFHHASKRISIHVISQVETNECGVSLRISFYTGLVGTVKRDGLRTVERRLSRIPLISETGDRVVYAQSGSGTEPGGGSSEKELPPSRAGPTRAFTLVGFRH